MIQSVKINKSTNPKKKYVAEFYDEKNNLVKKTDFGSNPYSDYTIHKDDERKKRYIQRHQKNENWNDFTSAGALSRWVLWNKPTFDESVKDYKKMFKLK